MNILVANNHLDITGGTENYTYAIIVELLARGHNVEYFTFVRGDIALEIEKLGVKSKSKRSYDLIIANHNTIVDHLYPYGYLIQTCHGIFPQLEQPSLHADSYVSISDEVQQHLLNNYQIISTIINNGVDCNRFAPKKKINKELTSVLSLCHSEEANTFISVCCDKTGIAFNKINKLAENKWGIEDSINNADLVIGIGRSLYDAMACGRAVISYDNRFYSKDFGDGYLNSKNVQEALTYNCSGRGLRKSFDEESFINELKKYNSEDGAYLRRYALTHLNIKLSVEKYLNLTSTFKLKLTKIKKILILGLNYLKKSFFNN